MTKDEKLELIEKAGFKAVSENLAGDLVVQCKNGHIFKRSFGHFKEGVKVCHICVNNEKRDFILSLGYKLLSDTVNKYVEVMCHNGHTFTRLFSSFKKGAIKCPECIKEEKISFLNGLGYTILSNNLSNNLVIQCKKRHIFKRMFSKIKNGRVNCPECEKEKYNQTRKKEIICSNKHKFCVDPNRLKKGCVCCPHCKRESYIKLIESFGYKILKYDSKNITVECKKGHIFNRDLQVFKAGSKTCSKCIEEDKISLLAKLGYKVVSDSLGDDLKVQCKNGHIFKRTFASFKRGNVLCNQCRDEEKIKMLNNIGYEVVSEDLVNDLEVKCKNGHIFKRPYDNFKKGVHLCSICNPSSSTFEQEIRDITGGFSDKTILNGYEIDIYIPDYKLAIECNGDYWYSESTGKDRNYHLNKTNKCLEKGIQLIHIFESSWNEKKDIWISIINNKLGKSNKIFARKCILKEVIKDEEKEFINENHLQGFSGSSICYGLYYNNELVCLMSFGKPRFSNKYDWELIRLCTKIGFNVIGGASKLLKHFHKNNKGSIISYSDRLYSDGGIYKKLGFTFSHYSKPGYFYFKHGKSFNRQLFMKHLLHSKLDIFDESKTESENMRLNGFHKVWDCGQGVWVK